MSLTRVAAIARADATLRFRRLSTLVVFLLLSAMAYAWVPDPSTGRAIMQTDGHRVVYDSAALGMSTAMLAAFFVGLFGFYVISHAIGRDVQSGCGFVIASTPVGSGEYLLGKLAGNLLFLTTFVSGFMLTAMAMLLVRGEAPLQPTVFVLQYLLLVPPSIVLVSVLALLFESVPFLSGRFGDVAYFFVWMSLMAVVAATQIEGASSALAVFDYAGMGYVMQTMKETLHTQDVSIGASGFDATKSTVLFPGLLLTDGWPLRRALATLTPLPLLLVARACFHRFDPARLRASSQRARSGWIARVNGWLKPVARRLAALLAGGGSGTSLLSAARADAVLTVMHLPLVVLVGAGLAVAAWVGDAAAVSAALPPVMLLALAVVVADVSTRDRSNGTRQLLFASPALRERFVAWKTASALLFAAAFVAVPLVRFALLRPAQVPGAIAGVIFLCAAAVACGVVSGTPKAFLVLFVSFWYVAVNDKGEHPALDFGGLYPGTPITVAIGYALGGVLLVLAADRWHRVGLARA